MERVVNVSEYVVQFNAKQFVKFFFFNILGFYLGPLGSAIIALIDTSHMARNTVFFWNGKQ